MTSRPVRVRFAPSPTGPLHIGGARTALYNFLHARSQGGVFVLRIDDTDRARSTDESLQNILEGMRWLGLDWDEGPEKGGAFGPYSQWERMAGYRERVAQLIDSGHAYACFATPEEVEEGRQRMMEKVGVPMYDRAYRDYPRAEADARIAAGEEHVVRFKIPEGRCVVRDAIKGDVEVDLAQIDDWVMVRKDGTPLYNLCSTLDDVDMEISDVIRGEEHFVNAVKQILLFQALDKEAPRFAHLPLILGKDGKKLSKRMAQTNLLDYKAQGYPADALRNFFTLLGWSYDGVTEIFTLEDAIANFAIDKLGKSGSVFDEEKMTWMCGMYIRDMPVDRLADEVAPFVAAQCAVDDAQLADARPWFANIVRCYQERFRFYSELPEKIAFFFVDAVEYDAKAAKNLRKSAESREWLERYRTSVAELALPPSWPNRPATADAIELPDDEERALPDGFEYARPKALEAHARAFAEELGVGFGKLVHPLRAAISGNAAGAGLFDLVYLIGRERLDARLAAAVELLGSESGD